MVALKNIQPEQVLSLAGQVTAQPGQIVSRTLAQTPAVSLTLFAFAKGEEISTHENPGATPWSRSWRAWAASRWMAWTTCAGQANRWSCRPKSPTQSMVKRISRCS